MQWTSVTKICHWKHHDPNQDTAFFVSNIGHGPHRPVLRSYRAVAIRKWCIQFLLGGQRRGFLAVDRDHGVCMVNLGKVVEAPAQLNAQSRSSRPP